MTVEVLDGGFLNSRTARLRRCGFVIAPTNEDEGWHEPVFNAERIGLVSRSQVFLEEARRTRASDTATTSTQHSSAA